jgi:hypothetical protein
MSTLAFLTSNRTVAFLDNDNNGNHVEEEEIRERLRLRKT